MPSSKTIVERNHAAAVASRNDVTAMRDAIGHDGRVWPDGACDLQSGVSRVRSCANARIFLLVRGKGFNQGIDFAR